MNRLMDALCRRVVAWLEKKRRWMVLNRVKGRLLDVGCGANLLVRQYGNGVGVDVYDWGDVDQVVQDTAHLPFEDGVFGTVSFVACLNHIPNRVDALREARRVLADDGLLLLTMIPPTLSKVWHALIRPWDEDQTERGMKDGEVWGFTAGQMRGFLEEAGFELVQRKCFVFGLNNLYVARKRGGEETADTSVAHVPDRQTFIVVRAYNEGRVIAQTVRPLIAAGYSVVVVDDGSTDQTGPIAARLPVYLVRHPVNLGPGAAFETGLRYAAAQDPRYVVFFDADGQHCAADIPALLEPLRRGRADVVFGSRFLRPEDVVKVPPVRRLVLGWGRVVNGVITGLWLSDAHNGMRAMTGQAAKSISLRERSFAYATELLTEVHRHHLRHAEVPVQIEYTDYSRGKGQSSLNAVNIMLDLMVRRVLK